MAPESGANNTESPIMENVQVDETLVQTTKDVKIERVENKKNVKRGRAQQTFWEKLSGWVGGWVGGGAFSPWGCGCWVLGEGTPSALGPKPLAAGVGGLGGPPRGPGA